MVAHPFYLFVKYISWIGLKLFFGNVDLINRHHIPEKGAVIFAPNHQGAFMDALVAGVYNSRPTYFLTRADIFKKKWVISILKSLQMMPIYRIRDGIQNLSQNDAMFDACFDILSKGKAVLIFPEGNHGAEYFLRPLSKGAARLALDARKALDPSIDLHIVPVGINYFSHRRALARVKMVFGKPIKSGDYMKLYDEHKQKAYNQFKSDLTDGLKQTMILTEEGEDYEQRKKFIFQPSHEDLSFEELKKMGDEKNVGVRQSRSHNFFVKALILLLTPFNWPPLFALQRFLRIFKDPAFIVSIKFLAGGIFHLLWWTICYTFFTMVIGWEVGLMAIIALAMIAMYRQYLIRY